jgi:hypothetical protein
MRRGNRDPREARLDCETGRWLIRERCSWLANSDTHAAARFLILLPVPSHILP